MHFKWVSRVNWHSLFILLWFDELPPKDAWKQFALKETLNAVPQWFAKYLQVFFPFWQNSNEVSCKPWRWLFILGVPLALLNQAELQRITKNPTQPRRLTPSFMLYNNRTVYYPTARLKNIQAFIRALKSRHIIAFLALAKCISIHGFPKIYGYQHWYPWFLDISLPLSIKVWMSTISSKQEYPCWDIPSVNNKQVNLDRKLQASSRLRYSQGHKWLASDLIFSQYVFVPLMYFDRKLLPRYSRFQLCCQPKFERRKYR